MDETDLEFKFEEIENRLNALESKMMDGGSFSTGGGADITLKGVSTELEYLKLRVRALENELKTRNE